MTTDKLRLLVLCTGNSCRSQMAEAFLRRALIDAKLISDYDQVRSAGIEAHGLNPRAVQVMDEIGIDISRQTSQTLGQFEGTDFDYVITVCDNAAENCPVYPSGTVRLHWPFADPARATGDSESVIVEFRRIRDEIGARAEQWVRNGLT